LVLLGAVKAEALEFHGDLLRDIRCGRYVGFELGGVHLLLLLLMFLL
jgi:hypothetical protein